MAAGLFRGAKKATRGLLEEGGICPLTMRKAPTSTMRFLCTSWRRLEKPDMGFPSLTWGDRIWLRRSLPVSPLFPSFLPLRNTSSLLKRFLCGVHGGGGASLSAGAIYSQRGIDMSYGTLATLSTGTGLQHQR